jgi:putative ABC transport system substrate-binding protein
MNRRTFLCGLTLGTLAAPLAAGAQQADMVRRIGFLHIADGSFSLPYLKPALADLGYVEGKSLVLETRFAHGNVNRLPALAAELVAMKVEVIVAAGDPAVRAAKAATTTIPIVMAFASLPVEHGFVKSLARPGGNITGVTVISDPGVDAKRIQFLREVAPTAKTVAMLQVAGAGEGEAAAVERAMRTLGVRLVVVKVRPGEYEVAFATMKRERAGALFVGRGPVLFIARRELIELAARHRIPAIWEARVMVEEGGLLSYGPSFPDLYRRAASVVDRIIKGANPADLPVEQPTTFELVINLKTAKALGLTIPPSLMLRADQVIE